MAHLVRQALDHADFATVPCAIAGCLATWPVHDVTAPEIVLGCLEVCSGIIAWTLVEYAVHRALHDKRLPRLRKLHMAHHQRPTDASGGTLYSSLIIVALTGAAVACTPATPTILGIFLGYLAFIVLHHDEHHAERALAASPMRWIAVHHYRHHHARPRGCFGVTTSIWDRLFGTL